MYSINEIKRILEDSKQQSNINVKPISLFDEEAMKYKMQYDSHILESLFKRFDVSNVDDDTLDTITNLLMTIYEIYQILDFKPLFIDSKKIIFESKSEEDVYRNINHVIDNIFSKIPVKVKKFKDTIGVTDDEIIHESLRYIAKSKDIENFDTYVYTKMILNEVLDNIFFPYENKHKFDKFLKHDNINESFDLMDIDDIELLKKQYIEYRDKISDMLVRNYINT